jgi:TRAP-type C4-dicarboxylate transport system permease small subunit
MKWLNACLRAVLFALIAALVLSVAVGVFYRYVLQWSLFWSTEVANFIFVWIVFLGAVVAYHEKKHIAFTALLDRMPGNRAKLEILGNLLVLGFALFMVVTGSEVVWLTLDRPSEALKLPLGYLYSVLPFAFAIIAIDASASIWNLLRGSPRKGEKV